MENTIAQSRCVCPVKDTGSHIRDCHAGDTPAGFRNHAEQIDALMQDSAFIITHDGHTYGPDCAEMDAEAMPRGADRAARAIAELEHNPSCENCDSVVHHFPPPGQTYPAVLSRYENNLSDARMLAEDAADLCRRCFDTITKLSSVEQIALAQTKALASIALSMAFGEGRR